MPFVPRKNRFDIDAGVPPKTPGDLCYVAYCEMVEKWKENPRWTTAHNIYQGIRCMTHTDNFTNNAIALDLAWQVFFHKYVMPYEDLKEKENGTI